MWFIRNVLVLGEQLIINREYEVVARVAVSCITWCAVFCLIRTRYMQLELAHCTAILYEVWAVLTADFSNTTILARLVQVYHFKSRRCRRCRLTLLLPLPFQFFRGTTPGAKCGQCRDRNSEVKAPRQQNEDSTTEISTENWKRRVAELTQYTEGDTQMERLRRGAMVPDSNLDRCQLREKAIEWQASSSMR